MLKTCCKQRLCLHCRPRGGLAVVTHLVSAFQAASSVVAAVIVVTLVASTIVVVADVASTDIVASNIAAAASVVEAKVSAGAPL